MDFTSNLHLNISAENSHQRLDGYAYVMPVRYADTPAPIFRTPGRLSWSRLWADAAYDNRYVSPCKFSPNMVETPEFATSR